MFLITQRLKIKNFIKGLIFVFYILYEMRNISFKIMFFFVCVPNFDQNDYSNQDNYKKFLTGNFILLLFWRRINFPKVFLIIVKKAAFIKMIFCFQYNSKTNNRRDMTYHHLLYIV
jgi:hypothetical protein